VTTPHADLSPSLRRRALSHGAYWFLMMAPLGLVLPYYALYLREHAGLTGAQIGAVFAVMPFVAMLAQPLWGVAADRTGMRARILVVLCFGAALGYLAIARADSFGALLAATALLALFARALLPLSLAVSIPALRDHAHAFGIVRALGTVGFGAAMFGFPWLVAARRDARGVLSGDDATAPADLELLFPLAVVLALAAALAALAVPQRGVLTQRAARGEWRSLLRNQRFRRVLTLGIFAFLLQNGPLEFFPVLVDARGWLSARFSPRALLAIGLFAGGLRWLGSAAVPSLAWLAPLQALHAVVVLGLMLGAPLYLDAAVPPQLRSTAQAGFAVVSVGVGGTASSLLSGWLLEFGGPVAPYWVAGAGSLLLALGVSRWLPRAAAC